MIKTLRPIGNSLGLIIDRPILDLLGIDRQSQLHVTTDGKVLYIEPVARDSRDKTRPSSRRKATSGKKASRRSGDKRG